MAAPVIALGIGVGFVGVQALSHAGIIDGDTMVPPASRLMHDNSGLPKVAAASKAKNQPEWVLDMTDEIAFIICKNAPI